MKSVRLLANVRVAIPPRLRSISAGVILLVVISATACAQAAARPSAPTPSPTPYPTLTPLPTATPLPSTPPVARVAGWETDQSDNWAGYSFPVTHVTGVRAQWIEPTVSGTVGDEESVWIGIGGWDNNNLIQVGTYAYLPATGGLEQGIFDERLPDQPTAQYPLQLVLPGDHIFASIEETPPSSQTWRMLLIDMSTGATFDNTVQFQSLKADPSFVVEDPTQGPARLDGPLEPFARWNTVTFTQMQMRIDTTWEAAAAQYGYRINMVRNGQVLATAGALDATSSFTATQP